MIPTMQARGPYILLISALILSLRPTPNSRLLRSDLAQLLNSAAAQNPSAALRAAERALTLEPGLLAVRALAARLAVAAGEPAAALEHLSEWREAGELPDEAECLELEALLGLGDLERAARALDRAGPGCQVQSRLFQELAASRLAAEDLLGAEQALERWALDSPGSAVAHRELGMLLSVRNPELALSHLKLALELAAGPDPLLSGLIRAIEGSRLAQSAAYTAAQVGLVFGKHGRWDLAAMALERAVELDPGLPEAQSYLGLALDQTGKDGLDHLLRGIELAPARAWTHLLLGIHWRRTGELRLALESLERAARLDPMDPAVAAELGATYSALGDPRSAKAAYMLATELAPGDSQFWQLLALFSVEQEIEIEDLGLPAARQAYRLSGGDPRAADLLGYCHALVGNSELAHRFLWEAVSADPNLASAHYHRGLLYLALGDPLAARSALQRAVELDPDGRIGELALRSLAHLAR